jgi:hypothetical protein
MDILAEMNLTLPGKKLTKLPCYDEKPGYNFSILCDGIGGKGYTSSYFFEGSQEKRKESTFL